MEEEIMKKTKKMYYLARKIIINKLIKSRSLIFNLKMKISYFFSVNLRYLKNLRENIKLLKL